MEILLEKIPDRLDRLEELAYNLWWAFNPRARHLFRTLDRPLWESTNHNPVRMLLSISENRLAKLTRNPSFLKLYDSVVVDFDSYLGSNSVWFQQNYPNCAQSPIAFVCAEFGIHQSLPIYSGGLGVLAGDICKEASDLGIPLVGVGFIYPQGYFRQAMPSQGWQEAYYDQFDFKNTPIRPVMQEGNQLVVPVKMGDREIHVRVWNLSIGRTNVYLMDTDIDLNTPWDRELSARLYWGDLETRLRWEIVLGYGAVRVLKALNIEPAIWHMNEGHTAFLTVERLRELTKQGYSYSDARQAITNTNRFTTHTPVPAGHDEFPFSMIEKYLSYLWETELDIPVDEFFSLASAGNNPSRRFNMTAFAIRMSSVTNAVSKLNCEVANNMWKHLWPSGDQTSIVDITNGVHTGSWVSGFLQDLFRKHLGPNWYDQHDSEDLWTRIENIPDRELWYVHQKAKMRLIELMRERAREKRALGQWNAEQILSAGALLDPRALTLGFARRFATYKRPNLIFRDLDRLKRILLDPYQPVQIIFAGKAHPADDPSKHLLQQVYNLAKDPQMKGRIAFLENYDMQMARYLVQGCDVWLNNPRRPLEASGTSGEKAAINGVPNFSVLDGWWAEGYTGGNGWTIGKGEVFDDSDQQDEHDATALYQTLENEIVPLFYEHHPNETPHEWVKLQKEAIKTSVARFSARRMVKDYVRKSYFPESC
ncbi:MAG: alpha-glucan family phosphorylase [Candidatus Heimdallarchaeota archaeon]